MRETYNAASEEEDGSQSINPRHDQIWNAAHEAVREADESDQDPKSAGESAVGCGGRCGAVHLPFDGSDGEAEDDGAEDGLECASDEVGEHLGGMLFFLQTQLWWCEVWWWRVRRDSWSALRSGLFVLVRARFSRQHTGREAAGTTEHMCHQNQGYLLHSRRTKVSLIIAAILLQKSASLLGCFPSCCTIMACFVQHFEAHAAIRVQKLPQLDIALSYTCTVA